MLKLSVKAAKAQCTMLKSLPLLLCKSEQRQNQSDILAKLVHKR